jgi:hypothetical protein
MFLATLFSLLLAADPAPAGLPPGAKVKAVHHLRCEEGARLFAALRGAGVAVVEKQGVVYLALDRLSCALHSGPPGVDPQTFCDSPKVSGDMAKRIWGALAQASLPVSHAALQAALEFSSVSCRSGPDGASCTLVNESGLMVTPEALDVRELGGELKPFQAPAVCPKPGRP